MRRCQRVGVMAFVMLGACGDELGSARCGAELAHDYRVFIPGSVTRDDFRIDSDGAFSAMYVGSDGVPVNCQRNVVSCEVGGSIDLYEVRAQFDHPEVVAAFDDETPLFGRNTGGASVIVIERDDGAKISLGEPCQGAASCVEVPAALGALRAFLTSSRGLIEQLLPEGITSCDQPDIDASVPDGNGDGGSDAALDAAVCTIDQNYRLYYDDPLDGGLNPAEPELALAADGSVRLRGWLGSSPYSCAAQLDACSNGQGALGDFARVLMSTDVASAFNSGLTYGQRDETPNDAYLVLERADGQRLRIGGCFAPACSSFPPNIVEASMLIEHLIASGRVGPLRDGGLAGVCQ